MPQGRPTKLTPAVINQIAEAFTFGFTDVETASLVGCEEKTIRRARTVGFCPAIKKAEVERKREYIRRIVDGKGNDWCRLAWFLERRWPLQFGRPEIQLSFNNSYTQNNLSITLSGPEAKSIEAEAQPVRAKIEEMFKQYRPENGNGNGEKHTTD